MMKKAILFSLLAVFVFVAAGTAQEHAEGGAAAEESPWAVVFRWVNFALLFGGLGYLLRKPAGDFFEGRRKEIADGLDRASHAEQNAQTRMTDIEQRLNRLSSDIAALRTEAERESGFERERIIAEARREVDRVVEQSRQEIERAARSAEREIKEGLADLVVDRAGNALRTSMTEDDQKRVIVRFIKKL